MKKILLILFIIPAFIFGQDIPLTEKKLTTKSMESKDKKLKEKEDEKREIEYIKSLGMKYYLSHKIQIGYITNPFSCPFASLV